MTRLRTVERLALIVLCLVAAGASAARAQAPPAFSHETVKAMAQELAKQAYTAPPEDAAKATKDLTYDQFRQIRFRRERTIWRGEGLNFELQVLPTGWLFKTPIDINLVDGGNVRPLSPDNSYFDLGPLAGKLPPEARLGFSGFRLTGPLNRLDLFDEIIVFQGASYFRALSRGQIYGLSARGLALNVGKPEGEEFPMFRRFWIEKPAAGAGKISIHALLDSPSVAGAYRFEVTPGWPTTIAVESTLYPRRDLSDVGIAPMTSMYLFSSSNRARINDFRPAVHDSDGLAVHNGWNERLWRPLNNPRRLETSDFLDQNPKGFGLIQRLRSFAGFQDLEADYERRPSAWVVPREEWGAGAVELIEIPSEEEIHDNIVAYWKPVQPLATGKAHSFNYTLSWPNDVPRGWPGAFVYATRAGLIAGPQRKAGTMQFVVDFKTFVPPSQTELPFAKVEASSGAIGAPVVQLNPEIDGLRVAFSFDPKGAATSELRLVLQANDNPISETWLYRWTKD
ncbi:MAG TPA: glucan biosynthesis protein G [Hyphomicrobiaceae bacterium]|nr:glucan biosynthesis protein G [Hyphomicrobiaceae bacterium]